MKRIQRNLRRVWIGLCLGLMLAVGSQANAQMATVDGTAFVQRISQLTITLGQWAAMLKTATDEAMMVKAAAVGIQDWRNFGWTAAFDLVNMPMFDGLSGIDDIRTFADSTSMLGGTLGSLFNQIETTQAMMNNPRFATDLWYREKVMALNSMSVKARAIKMALITSMRNQVTNIQTYVAQIKKLQAQVETIATSTTPDTKKMEALQSRIAELQAQVDAAGIVGKNQEIISRMAGTAVEQQFWETQFGGMTYNNNEKQLNKLGAALGGAH